MRLRNFARILVSVRPCLSCAQSRFGLTLSLRHGTRHLRNLRGCRTVVSSPSPRLNTRRPSCSGVGPGFRNVFLVRSARPLLWKTRQRRFTPICQPRSRRLLTSTVICRINPGFVSCASGATRTLSRCFKHRCQARCITQAGPRLCDHRSST